MKSIIFFFYFLSGAAGLIYETIWIRQFSSILGGTSFALGMVLSAFMLGLAGGSFILGKSSSSWESPLKLYGILELGIGIWGLLFPFLLYGLDLFLGWIAPYFPPGSNFILPIKFFLSLLVLVVPCGLMGGTFPVLGRYIVNNKETVGHSVGVFYGLNLLGALLGCLVSGFFLVEHLGLAHTNFVAVFLNLAVGLVTLILWKQTKNKNLEKPFLTGDRLLLKGFLKLFPKTFHIFYGSGASPSLRLGAENRGIAHMQEDNRTRLISTKTINDHNITLTYWALGAVFLSGFFALSLEVITHRVLFLILRNTTYASTLMLATTLSGLFAGNFLISRWADRIKNPWAVTVGALVTAAFYTVLTIPLYGWMDRTYYNFVVGRDFFGGSWIPYLLAQAGVCMAVLFIPMLLLGAIFPLACRLSFSAHSSPQDDFDTAPYLGGLYATNTVGAILGSLGTSFIGIPLWGARNTLLLAAGVLLSGGIFILWGNPAGSPKTKTISIGSVLLIALLMGGAAGGDITFREAARGAEEEVLFYREDKESLIEIYRSTRTGALKLISNRQQQEGDSSLSSIYNLRQPYYLPLLLHPNPRRVLGIGLGTGISFAAVGAFDIQSAECIEISPAIIEAVSHFSRYNREIYRDPRVRIIREDGRQYLRRSNKRYDVILADLFTPYRLGVGSLYTKEHYQTCRDHLAPGGIICQLLPIHQLPPQSLKIIVRTFREVFPESSLWMTRWAFVMIGSPRTIRIDFQTIKQHFQRPEIRSDLETYLLDDPYEFLAAFVTGKEGLSQYTAGYSLNTDDKPLVEFITPRSFHLLTDGPLYWANLEEVLNYRQSVLPYMAKPDKEITANIRRYYQAKSHSLKGKIYNAKGQYTKALEEFLTAHAQNRYDMEARKFLEAHFLGMGKEFYEYRLLKEAKKNFHKALESYPLSVEALLLLGELAWSEGNFPDAGLYWKKAFKINPDYPPTQTHLQRLPPAGRI